MQFDDFINRVQEQTRVDTPQEAVAITKAVLETLGERLDRKVRNGVAAQLPKELKEFLLARNDKTDHYGVTEFYHRVGARSELKSREALIHTRQVFGVLRQAIPEGEIQDILEDLPEEYESLFETELPNPGR
jgi:uncharacterized protein (DUF2267 family)